jgi:gamma-glutamyltranspeptidase
MDDFSKPDLTNYFGYKPSEKNYIKPGKRPMSSMSPIIVLDKTIMYVLYLVEVGEAG